MANMETAVTMSVRKHRATVEDEKQADMERLCSTAVGFEVGLYWGTGSFVVGKPGNWYQVMPQRYEDEVSDFWHWAVVKREQWHRTPERACVEFVRAYRDFVRMRTETTSHLENGERTT
jgi:hypothetical protein